MQPFTAHPIPAALHLWRGCSPPPPPAFPRPLTPFTACRALHTCPQVLAPYAVVPGGSSLVYEVELLRLSAVGPDQLTAGISKCGQGGAGQQSGNCADISYAEFL